MRPLCTGRSSLKSDDCWGDGAWLPADSLQPEARVAFGSGELLHGVALTDDPAFDDSAEHSAPAPDFFAQTGPQVFHLAARSARHRYFEKRFAHSQGFARLKAVDVQPIGRDVLSDHSRAEMEDVERFAVYQEDLAVASRTFMSAALEADAFERRNFGEFLHGPAAFGSTEEF